jgi:hypothetical protein
MRDRQLTAATSAAIELEQLVAWQDAQNDTSACGSGGGGLRQDAGAAATEQQQQQQQQQQQHHLPQATAAAAVLCVRASAVRAALEVVAVEESGHAVLAWKTMAWLVSLDDSSAVALGDGGGAHLSALVDEWQRHLLSITAGSSSLDATQAVMAVELLPQLLRRAAGAGRLSDDDDVMAVPKAVQDAVDALRAAAAQGDESAVHVLAGVEVIRAAVERRW